MVYLYSLRPEDIVNGIVNENSDRCLLPDSVWQSMLEEDHSDIDGMYLVRFTDETSGNSVTLSVGGGHDDEDTMVFVPQWVFLHIESEKDVRFEFLTELPPNATMITIKPLDNALYCVDIAEDVGAVLSNWNVIHKGTILSIPLSVLGGYVVEVFIEKVEPEDCVLLRGNVPLELTESVETVPEFQPQTTTARPATPIPENLPVFQTTPSLEHFMGSMVPSSLIEPPLKKRKLIPFQGTGRRLCDG